MDFNESELPGDICTIDSLDPKVLDMSGCLHDD
jgi:hypothetical protein